MTIYLQQTIQRIFLFILVLSLAACQRPTQNLSSPTTAYRTATPLPALTSEPNPVVIAFKRLEELDSYRMTITIMDGKETRIAYLFEKNGQGKFRISFTGKEPYTLVVDGRMYGQDALGMWRIVPDQKPQEREESWWLLYLFMAGDDGCAFDFEHEPTIEYVYKKSGLFREIVVGYSDTEGFISDPGLQCELTINSDGYPRRIVTETLGWDQIIVTMFTDFDGADIAPIVAPTIK